MPTASTCSSAIAQHRSVYFSGVGTGSYLVPPTKAIAPPTAAFAPDEKSMPCPLINQTRLKYEIQSGLSYRNRDFIQHVYSSIQNNEVAGTLAHALSQNKIDGQEGQDQKGQAATAKADVWVVLRIGAARNRLKWKDRTFGFGRVFSVSIETLDQREVPICLVRMMDQINV